MTRLNLGSGIYTIDGFDNLDLTTGWRFEDGLPNYQDGSVEAITVSHALMFVTLDYWPFVFAEMARVLEPGGILRIAEDSTADRTSERFGGLPEAVTLTTPERVFGYMLIAGLTPVAAGYDETSFRDRSLIQKLHGPPPKTFAVEGRKP